MDTNMKPPILSTYEHQVGGRSQFVNFSPGHLMKLKAEEDEAKCVLQQIKELNTITPHYCLVKINGEVLHLKGGCGQCREMAEEGTRIVPNNECAIVMEDLTVGMAKPVSMDLKLGTRQHGDKCSPEKAERAIAKNKISTTGKYGVRLGGCKADNIDVSRRGGRDLTFAQMANNIRLFFGSKETKARAVQLLRDVKAVLEKIDGLRLFGASLLFVMDAGGRGKAEDTIKLKLIDFAKASHPSLAPEIIHSGVDAGAITGINTVIGILEAENDFS